MKHEKIIIDDVEYRPVSDQNGEIKIVVLDRGFVVVGRVRHDDNYFVIEDCSCIRVWGATRGLGQIASGGPTTDTELDPQGTTRVHELQVVQTIDCEASQWNL